MDTDENGNLVVHTHQAEHVQAKAATCTEDGNIEYWYCPACGSYFSDAALTTEITLADTVVKAVGHQAEKVEAKPATKPKQAILSIGIAQLAANISKMKHLHKRLHWKTL